MCPWRSCACATTRSLDYGADVCTIDHCSSGLLLHVRSRLFTVSGQYVHRSHIMSMLPLAETGTQ